MEEVVVEEENEYESYLLEKEDNNNNNNSNTSCPLQSYPQCLATQSPCRRTHSAWRGRLAGGASRLHTLKLTLAGQWQHFLPPRRYSLILPRLTGVFFLSLSPSLLACVLWLLSCPRRQILRYFHFYVWVSIFHSCGKNSCYFLPSFSFQLLVLCWFASIKNVDFFFFERRISHRQTITV